MTSGVYTIVNTVADGAVSRIDIHGLAKQETWDIGFHSQKRGCKKAETQEFCG